MIQIKLLCSHHHYNFQTATSFPFQQHFMVQEKNAHLKFFTRNIKIALCLLLLKKA